MNSKDSFHLNYTKYSNLEPEHIGRNFALSAFSTPIGVIPNLSSISNSPSSNCRSVALLKLPCESRVWILWYSIRSSASEFFNNSSCLYLAAEGSRGSIKSVDLLIELLESTPFEMELAYFC